MSSSPLALTSAHYNTDTSSFEQVEEFSAFQDSLIVFDGGRPHERENVRLASTGSDLSQVGTIIRPGNGCVGEKSEKIMNCSRDSDV